MHRGHAAGILIMRIDATSPAADIKLVACTCGGTGNNMDHSLRSRAQERLMTVWLDVQRRVGNRRGCKGDGEVACRRCCPVVFSNPCIGSKIPLEHLLL